MSASKFELNRIFSLYTKYRIYNLKNFLFAKYYFNFDSAKKVTIISILMAVQSKHHFDLFISEHMVEVIRKKELYLSKDNGLFSIYTVVIVYGYYFRL